MITLADAAIALGMPARGELSTAEDISDDGWITSLGALLMVLQTATGAISLALWYLELQ